jgi:hypothetical protein
LIPDPGSQVKSIDVRLAPLLPALKASDAIIDEALDRLEPLLHCLATG